MWIISAASAPAISIEQKTTSKNPRSTVGTVTEIYDYLRLLFARALARPTARQPAFRLRRSRCRIWSIVVMTMEEGTRAHLLAPIVRDRKGNTKNSLNCASRLSSASKVDGEYYEIGRNHPRWTKNSAMTSTLWWIALLCGKGWKHALPIVSAQPLTLRMASAVLETVPR